MPTHATYKYPSYNIDSYLNNGGGTLIIPLQRNALISEYTIIVQLGSLNGGSSPSWTVSASNPIIQNIQINSDNDTWFNMDTDMLQEYLKLFFHYAPNGLLFDIPASDYTVAGDEIPGTQFPSYMYINNNLYLKIPPLSSVTSGSPTASSGTTVYLVEKQYLKPVDALVKVKKIQTVTNLQSNGYNYLVPSPFLTVDGLYKLVMYQQSQNGALSDNYINEIKLELNGSITLYDEYIQSIKAKNYAIFRQNPDPGYWLDVYMPYVDVRDMLPLLNPNEITSVKQTIVTTTSPVQVKAVKVEYMV